MSVLTGGQSLMLRLYTWVQRLLPAIIYIYDSLPSDWAYLGCDAGDGEEPSACDLV